MLKKIGLIIIILSLLLTGVFFLLIKHNLPRSYHHTFTASTELKGENINGMNLFDNINDKKFLDKYGEELLESANNENHKYFKIDSDIEIAVNKYGEIVRFIVGRDVATSKGIKVGDSVKKVKSAYGKNSYLRSEQGVNILGYVDKKRNQSIEFWHVQNMVIFYRFDHNSMK
ncbi:hypothetical protein D0469_05620 [Peribacillus saganii]|uniref:Uncharacterized protein n=1 Tax=Peribacillus saganii TaxID=2303992 RepID=A0A372LS37_9BACI|nr:hypothetical protein [Peribacillus saganii]RFU70612.1 hypothetical protein D0469_05620 [Peribacillus saganii]